MVPLFVDCFLLLLFLYNYDHFYSRHIGTGHIEKVYILLSIYYYSILYKKNIIGVICEIKKMKTENELLRKKKSLNHNIIVIILNSNFFYCVIICKVFDV